MFRCRANRTQGRRAVGGHLVGTTGHAQFTPHRFDADRGGEEWGAELREIETVGKMPRTWNRYDGGLRVRLELTMRDGHSELFVVPKVDRVIAQIGPLVEAARGRRF